jgi:hypothetical protein
MMRKRQAWSGREVGGIVFWVIFCVALAVGLWMGLAGNAARCQPDKTTARAEKQAVNEQSAFYCNTKSLSIKEWAHKIAISAKMRNARMEIKELRDGYAFRFRPGGVSLVELADWVASEARCCPFFDMGIEVEREGGPVWLTLRGREGVKQFIKMEFKLNGEEVKQ